MSNFWENKALSEISTEEWESLCDGCGLCCLHKLEDDETGNVFYTRVACKLLDTELCHCKHYETRIQHVPDCLTLTANSIANHPWLPESCAYRLLSENKPLPSWHPLISKSSASIHEAGISVAGKAVSEADIHPDDIESFILYPDQ